MGARMILLEVVAPADGPEPEQLETFLRERYLPAVRMSPTRLGEIDVLRVWRGWTDTHEPSARFVVELRYGGMASIRPVIDDDEVAAEYERLGLSTELLGSFDQVAERAVRPGV
jgi:hypothetical protein